MLSINQLHNFVGEASSRRLKTPYMLTDLNIIRNKCRTFKKQFPKVKLYYAVKCFDDAEVIRTIEPLVDGFDVASLKEIERLLELKIDPSRITFSNPVKSEETIRKVAQLGAKKLAFQSYNELVKITKYAPHSEVYVRVKMDDSHGAISFSSKFGCPPEEAIELMKAAKQLGLRPSGITFHIGSQATHLSAWPQAIHKAQRLVEKAYAEGLDVDLINLGGGYPVQYSPDDPTIEDVALLVNGAIAASSSKFRYMAEPGRFLVADSSVIVASVIGVEDRDSRTWLYLDVGTFHAFIEVFEFHRFLYPVYSLSHIQKGLAPTKYKNYVLTGPTCDSYDTMAFKVKLPSDIAVGAKLLISMTGAYTVVYGSEFNGFRVPPRHFFGAKTLIEKKVRAYVTTS